MDLLTIVQILESTLRLATPLLFACLAGIVTERAGIFDIGLEGKLLISAFFSAAFAYYSGSAWVGLLVGILASVVFSILHGLASITFRGNQLIWQSISWRPGRPWSSRKAGSGRAGAPRP